MMISSLCLPSASSLAKSTAQNEYQYNKRRICGTPVPALLCSSQKSLASRSNIETPPPFLPPQQAQHLPSLALAAGTLALSFAAIADPAAALELHMEPSNALSLPTWAVHTSSVIEWLAGMGLMWRYGEVSGNPRWKGMTWGMLPCLGSAMCACTWHFFYNAPELEFLVTLQAGLTVLGNFTCWAAAYRIYQSAQTEGA
ncbi:putative Ycf49-like protein [Nannochloris sp. 'desiccata']|nr:hypothetical protein KSW81_007452 [Chlorella desiccata (nom. nud.)]KAH7618682.1 putative Ycf49-like protein [Chlorella desiccata (nom. nud.)]